MVNTTLISSSVSYFLDPSGHLYGTLLSLGLDIYPDQYCTVLRMVSKFIPFRNAQFQTALPPGLRVLWLTLKYVKRSCTLAACTFQYKLRSGKQISWHFEENRRGNVCR